ncbi:MAG: ABC transporter permease subunit, partial [Gammaproteobacteria bacterium]|nr:ABC transporter permease subunit [Gammaproteobacteria bacterium]
FSLPGMGLYLVRALEVRDFPIIQSVVLLIAFAFALVNLIVDLLYGFIDPRIRQS